MAGTFIIIGGREEREGERAILREFVARAHKGAIVLITTASSEYADELSRLYQGIFADLGAKEVIPLQLEDREGALSIDAAEAIDGAQAVFFSGGDQLRLTSRLANTPILSAVQRLYERGGVVAGTSAGASALGDTMVLPAGTEFAITGGHAIRTAAGFGLMKGVIVDQHFAERGRLGRLLFAVAQNPNLLGIGIDEDTAVLVEHPMMTVIGKGGVYVLDGSMVTFSTIGDVEDYEHLAVHDLKVHLLAPGHLFDLGERRPSKELVPTEVASAPPERQRKMKRRWRDKRKKQSLKKKSKNRAA